MSANVVDVKVAVDSLLHLEELLGLGLLQGNVGYRFIDPKVRLLADALYHALTGGTVTGTVPGTLTVTTGNASMVIELQTMEQKCLATVNAINAGQPYNLVAEV